MLENTNDSNRRERYRLAPPPVLEPILTIIHEGRRVIADNVIDVNLSGARIEFEVGKTSTMVPGLAVTVSIQAPGLDGCADMPARIVFSGIAASRHVVGLVFTETPELSDRSTSDFFSVFNRRGDRRQAAPASESVISAYLVGNDGISLTVLNHSRRGIGFTVDRQADTLLRKRESLSLAVRMPQREEPMTVSVRVCHRATRSDSVYYGCMIQETVAN